MAPIGNPVIAHVRSAQMALFIRGKLHGEQAERICQHVLVCVECQEEVQEIAELLWPSMSPWIKAWLRFFSPSWPPSRVFHFLTRTSHRLRRSLQTS